jgi:hypothetical protein
MILTTTAAEDFTIMTKNIHDDQTCKAGPIRPKNLVAASAWPSDFVENMIMDKLQ